MARLSLAQAGALPGHWPHVTLALGQGFNLTAFALSLLLVFRTNSSYDRWWEARKLWGGVVNRCRDIVRQVGRHGATVTPGMQLGWRVQLWRQAHTHAPCPAGTAPPL